MADRPILFSAPMVRSLLAGTKTQTRRLIPPATGDAYAEYDDWCRNVSAGVPTSRQWEPEYFLERTRIKAGDRLWVREAWRTHRSWDVGPPRGVIPAAPIWFEADPFEARTGLDVGKLRPSMFMPRWASRLTLTVTDVRVQRLQDISEADAIAEGLKVAPDQSYNPQTGAFVPGYFIDVDGETIGGSITPQHCYSLLWEHINGAGSWAANPFVAAYTFTVERRNIDVGAPHV